MCQSPLNNFCSSHHLNICTYVHIIFTLCIAIAMEVLQQNHCCMCVNVICELVNDIISTSPDKLHSCQYINTNNRIYNIKLAIRLYSDRTEHFCGRGPQILTKLLEGGPYMKKIVISPSEPFLVIRVCQKCQKIKKHEKPGFWGFFSHSS